MHMYILHYVSIDTYTAYILHTLSDIIGSAPLDNSNLTIE